MAWVQGPTAAAASAASVSKTFVGSTPAGNLVVAVITQNNGANPPRSITNVRDDIDGAVDYTLGASKVDAGVNTRVDIYYRFVTSPGIRTVTCSFSGGSADCRLAINEYDTAQTVASVTNTNTGTTSPATPGAANPAGTALYIVGLTHNNDGAMTPDAAWNERQENETLTSPTAAPIQVHDKITSGSQNPQTTMAPTIGTWVSAIITFEGALPTILTQPSDTVVLAGNTATFSVVDNDGSPSTYTYQWKRKDVGQNSFGAIGGATSKSYTTPATVKATDDWDQYQVDITNVNGTTTSVTVTLRVYAVQSAYSGTGLIVGAGYVGEGMVGAQDSTGISTASLTQTLNAVTLSSATQLAIAAAFNQTLGAVTLSSATQLAISATLAQTLGAVTLSSAVGVEIHATLNQTLANVTAVGAVGDEIRGTTTRTLADVTSSAAATLAIAAAETTTLAAVTTAPATGALAIVATLNQTLGAVTLVSHAGADERQADLAVTLGDVTSAAVATLAIAAAEATTLGAVTTAPAAGALEIRASLNQSLANCTSLGAVGEAISGTTTRTLGALTSTGAAVNAIAAALTQTLGSIQISAAAANAIRAALAQTLGALTPAAGDLAANTGAPRSATLAATLDALTLSAAATGLAVVTPPASTSTSPGQRIITTRTPWRSPTYFAPTFTLRERRAELRATLEDVRLNAHASMAEAPFVTMRRRAVAIALAMH